MCNIGTRGEYQRHTLHHEKNTITGRPVRARIRFLGIRSVFVVLPHSNTDRQNKSSVICTVQCRIFKHAPNKKGFVQNLVPKIPKYPRESGVNMPHTNTFILHSPFSFFPKNVGSAFSSIFVCSGLGQFPRVRCPLQRECCCGI